MPVVSAILANVDLNASFAFASWHLKFRVNREAVKTAQFSPGDFRMANVVWHGQHPPREFYHARWRVFSGIGQMGHAAGADL
ncbi:MAG: hypothetical protein DMG22_19965 [Acidobacteria bacterium]|nr:MAG: hypothetical protein DMG22_19965 [Acidobacteriota bacterium]